LGLAVIAAFVIGLRNMQENRAQRKREIEFQRVVRTYSDVLKRGMTRKEVEDYFHSKKIVFHQMCCVDTKSVKREWDDLTKISQEDPPVVCRAKNIYVAFQFAGTRPHEAVTSAEDSDRLTAVTVYPSLEGCL
jgi:hypothetical protein